MSESLLLRVHRIAQLTTRVRAFTLADAQGAALPAAEAGAHIEVEVEMAPGRKGYRAYSLVLTAEQDGPADYEIAVQHEEAGSGGSRFMHGLREGDLLRARAPANHFGLEGRADGTSEHLLLAGGIGITPILSMARVLAGRGERFALHYAARSPEAMPYQEQVRALPGSSLYFDGGDPARGIPLGQVLSSPQPGQPQRHLYVCGPRGLIEAAVQAAAQNGWPDDCVHYELFSGALAAEGDGAFEVECARSGRVLSVPAKASILDVLVEHGFDPLFDCRTGSCGVCVTPVLAGVPDHRDSTLSAAEKSAGRQVCICVSRARTPRLVLDL